MCKTVAILGGTGHVGLGLALRWAKAGYRVIIGSRQADKARRTAGELNERLDQPLLWGMVNFDAAQASDVAVLTVPYAAQESVLRSVYDALQTKVLVSTVVPLHPSRLSCVYVPPSGSALAEAYVLLGEGVSVAAAFQNVSAEHLQDPDYLVDCDVLVCGQKVAKAVAFELVEAAGMRGFDAGGISNAVVVEGLTSVLIGINLRHKVNGAGIRVTGMK